MMFIPMTMEELGLLLESVRAGRFAGPNPHKVERLTAWLGDWETRAKATIDPALHGEGGAPIDSQTPLSALVVTREDLSWLFDVLGYADACEAIPPGSAMEWLHRVKSVERLKRVITRLNPVMGVMIPDRLPNPLGDDPTL